MFRLNDYRCTCGWQGELLVDTTANPICPNCNSQPQRIYINAPTFTFTSARELTIADSPTLKRELFGKGNGLSVLPSDQREEAIQAIARHGDNPGLAKELLAARQEVVSNRISAKPAENLTIRQRKERRKQLDGCIVAE